MTNKKPEARPAAHPCGRKGCDRAVAVTAQHLIPGTGGPHHVHFCLEHASDLASVMPKLLAQMTDGCLEEIRIVSTAKLARDVDAGPLDLETDEEIDNARQAGIAAYLRLIGEDGELGGLLEHHSDSAVMEAFATLMGALFRHGYLGMADRPVNTTWWTRIMSIGTFRALAHGGISPKERLEVARGFVETAERLMKYKFSART